jgi:hypothetical protein
VKRRPVLPLLAISATFAVLGPSIDRRRRCVPRRFGEVRACPEEVRPLLRGRCLKPNVSDYDCAGCGNGLYYVRGPTRSHGRQ